MKFLQTVVILFLFQTASAAELKIIQSHKKKLEPTNENHYLMSIGRGEKGSSYEVQSSQIEKSAFWNAQEKPPTSVDQAIDIAFQYHNIPRTSEAFRVQEVALRPAASFSEMGNVWFYQVTIAEYPLDPGYKQYYSIILVSGEVVEPYYYDK